MMQFGSIVLSRKIFDILWYKDEIKDVVEVKSPSCLRCNFRANICEYAEEFGHDVYIGDAFDADEGVNQIKEDLKKSSKTIFSYIPDFLIEELIPLIIKDKENRILMPYGHRIHPAVRGLPHSRIARRFIKPHFIVHNTHHVMGGGICFPHTHYGVAWKDDKILEIRTVKVKECVRCMVEKHITAWSFGKRIRS
jgi:hypothetical protein